MQILVWLRVSTETQELVNQKNEMRDFVKSMGYDENDIIYVEGIGASAIKINDEYVQMYNEVKRYIENKQICAVAVWAVNRLARDEEWFVKFKKLFIENKVQFLVKNPTLALLNNDGSVNAGSELALSLFSTMAKQEMEERKEKFKRTKKAYAKQGKYIGGRTKKFGYRVDENQFFVEDENDGEIVKVAFQLYSTGEYSAMSLAKELVDRGYKRNDGLPINMHFMVRLLESATYTGEPDEGELRITYPPLVSKEIFDKCREIAQGNRLTMRQGERIVMGAKLIKCKECGSTYTSNSRHFMCTAGAHKNCKDRLAIRQLVVDHICWDVAFQEHMKYLMEMSENNAKVYSDRIEIIDKKIEVLQEKLNEAEVKKQRIVDTFLEGYLDKKNRDIRLSKLQDDTLSQQKEMNALEGEKRAILELLNNVDNEKDEWLYFNTLDTMDKSVRSDEDNYKIIHQHIIRIEPESLSYGIRDPRTHRPNAVLFTIYTVSGKVYKYMFFPKKYQGHNLMIWDAETEIWKIGDVILYDNNYVRKEAN